MEYKTVLGKPGLPEPEVESGIIERDRKLHAYVIARGKSRAPSRFCRRCVGGNVFVAFLLVFLVVLMGAMVQQHVEIFILKRDLTVVMDKVDDLLLAKLIEYNLDSEAYKKGEKLPKKEDPEESDTRDKRTGSNCPYTERPSFFIRGADNVLPAIRFLWQKGNNSFDRNIDSDNFQAESYNAKHVWGMRIKHRGLYFVFAQLKVAGRLERRSQFPAVGFSVMKKSSLGNEETIGSSFITQDQRGASYMDLYESYPVDTVQFSGLVNLQRDEILFVQRLEHQLHESSQIRFQQTSADAHFGTFMVSGECG